MTRDDVTNKRKLENTDLANQAFQLFYITLDGKVQQPLGHIFCRGEDPNKLTPKLIEAVEKLQKSGLTVVGGVADGLQAMKTILDRMAQKFEDFVVLIDYDHCFKNLRNPFLNKPVVIDGVAVSYRTLERLKRHANPTISDLFKHLTDMDINPKDRMKTEHVRRFCGADTQSALRSTIALMREGKVEDANVSELEACLKAIEVFHCADEGFRARDSCLENCEARLENLVQFLHAQRDMLSKKGRIGEITCNACGDELEEEAAYCEDCYKTGKYDDEFTETNQAYNRTDNFIPAPTIDSWERNLHAIKKLRAILREKYPNTVCRPRYLSTNRVENFFSRQRGKVNGGQVGAFQFTLFETRSTQLLEIESARMFAPKRPTSGYGDHLNARSAGTLPLYKKSKAETRPADKAAIDHQKVAEAREFVQEQKHHIHGARPKVQTLRNTATKCAHGDTNKRKRVEDGPASSSAHVHLDEGGAKCSECDDPSFVKEFNAKAKKRLPHLVMIQCDGCNQHSHLVCVGETRRAVRRKEAERAIKEDLKWHCRKCEAKH